MKKILIININWLGDILFSTPAIRALRENNPQAHLACMIVPRCREMLEGNPHLNELIIYDEDGSHKSFFGKWALVRKLRRERFDEAYIFHRSLTRGLIAFLAGIPVRVGYNTKRRGFLLTKAVLLPPPDIHRVEYFLGITRAMGYDTANRDYEFFIPKGDKDKIALLLQEKGITPADFVAVLNPGGNWLPKRWPAERFAWLGDALIRDLRAKVVISGADKDRDLAERISQQMAQKPIVLAGKITLKQLGALMQRADCVVSADSGPMHIAVAVKHPRVIALFGPTRPDITGPSGQANYTVIHKDIGCDLPCYNQDCRDFRCMQAITADEVLEVIRNDLR